MWSIVLTGVGLTSQWLIARRDAPIGWAIGIGDQVLWVAFGYAIGQWGFYFSACAYGVINYRGLRKSLTRRALTVTV